MKIRALHIHETDDVIVVTADAQPGDELLYSDGDKEIIITAKTKIPVYHKAAIRDIKKGEPVYKYNAEIGIALDDIQTGEHVHVHNLNSRDLIS